MNSHAHHTPGNDHLRILELVRDFELDLAIAQFPKAEGHLVRVLELGAGTGQQARKLQALGYEVTAIDLPTSPYRDRRVFPVQDYDGINIPAPDHSFDVVFSSHVLEHVVDLEGLLSETRRVLKPGGRCVHLMPTSSNRIWSIPGHYLWMARRVFTRAISVDTGGRTTNIPRTPSSPTEWLQTLFPCRHGERGNTLTETYYFSRRWWVQKFEGLDFKVEKILPNGLFYTMANVAGVHLSIPRRRALSAIFGSACSVYLLKTQGD